MITIDRTSILSVHDQLVDQIRYLIASGHFKVGNQLPSTRLLGEQVGVSFHTIRKAYQQLESEGLLQARVGRGYVVQERAPLDKEARMDRGAAIVQESLQRMIGLGLDESEMEYLFQEQLTQLLSESGKLKMGFAAGYRESAILCARQLSMALQQTVEAWILPELDQHVDADFVFVRLSDLQAVRSRMPRADVIGVATALPLEQLKSVSELLPDKTLGLITRYADAIGPLSAEIRHDSGFRGQIMAVSIEDGARHLEQFIPQTDFILYTPGCRRALSAHLYGAHPSAEIVPNLSSESLELIRKSIPGLLR